MNIDIYEPWSNKIEILNFNQKYLSINEPVEIYWYAKHYDVKSVAFCDDRSTKSLEMFLTICDDLKLKPIYGVKFKVKTIEDTAVDIVETICYAKNSKGNVMGELVYALGCENIADSDDSLLENLSLEHIVVEDPDYIFICQHGDDPDAIKAHMEEFIAENPAWSELTAVKEDRVYYMEKELYTLKPNDRWAEAYEKVEKILFHG